MLKIVWPLVSCFLNGLGFVLQDKCHPQTIEVCKTRASGLGLNVIVGDEAKFVLDKDVSGILLQYPATDGSIHDYKVRPATETDSCAKYLDLAVFFVFPLFSIFITLDESHRNWEQGYLILKCSYVGIFETYFP